jgi:hypothetical protein
VKGGNGRTWVVVLRKEETTNTKKTVKELRLQERRNTEQFAK